MSIASEAFKFITALHLRLFVKFVALKEWNQAFDQDSFLINHADWCQLSSNSSIYIYIHVFL